MRLYEAPAITAGDGACYEFHIYLLPAGLSGMTVGDATGT